MSGTVQQLARSIRSHWRHGQRPDALAALADHPAIGNDDKAVLDLAYEEFCLRRLAGEKIDPDEYCRQFPACGSLLRLMVEADTLFGDNPQYVDEKVVEGDHWPLSGQELCGCRVGRELGRGTFARVYLATEASTGGRPVVLKVSRSDTHEACTLGRLHHDGVVPVLWARRDEASGWNVVCMPFLGSATLLGLWQRLYPLPGTRPPERAQTILDAISRMSWPEDPQPDQVLPGPDLRGLTFVEGVTRLGGQLAEALAFLHRQQLYHCDLKPPNVLLTSEGRPMLLDFNLARRGGEAAPVGGTFAYMAPEHLEAFLAKKPLTDEQAGQADLFALGVLLYELLTGSHPYGPPPEGPPQDSAEAMLRLQKRGFAPIRSLNPAVSRRVARLIESCLCLDPAGRPASAAQVAAELQPRRIPRLLGQTAALLAVVAGVLTWMAVKGQPAESLASQSPEELRARAKQELRAGILSHRQGKPDQARQHLSAADDLFDRAIAAHKRHSGEQWGDWQDYFGRCRALTQRGDPASGQLQYEATVQARKAQGISDNRAGAILAYSAYCLALANHHKSALLRGEEALKAGYRAPAVLNNLAYSAMQFNQPTNDYLDEALKGDSRSPAIYLNRAYLAYKRHVRQSMKAVPNAFLPLSALQDVQKAIELHSQSGLPQSAYLYEFAAKVSDRVGQNEQGNAYQMQARPIKGQKTASLPDWSIHLIDPLGDDLD
jgi:serine/threonine protein kinase